MEEAAGNHSKIGFIGLGDIGLPMAEHILRKGFRLLAYDLRPQAIEDAKHLGAHGAASVKSMAAECEYSSIVVVNEAQVDSLVSGPDGIFANARPGTVILSHSTMPPDAAQR